MLIVTWMFVVSSSMETVLFTPPNSGNPRQQSGLSSAGPKCLNPAPSLRCLHVRMTCLSLYWASLLSAGTEPVVCFFHNPIWPVLSFGHHSLSATQIIRNSLQGHCFPKRTLLLLLSLGGICYCRSLFTASKWRWKTQHCFGYSGKTMSISSRNQN